MKSVAGRMLFMYLAMQAMNYFKAKPTTGPSVATEPGAFSNMAGEPPGNMFPKGTIFVRAHIL